MKQRCFSEFLDFMPLNLLNQSEKEKDDKSYATHSSTLAWKVPWTEEPGGLQSMGLQRVEHDWAASLTHSLTGCSMKKREEI